MKPGEIKIKNTEIEINQGHFETVINVKNTGDRPIQVGSHFHFFEVNEGLKFDREKAYGKHLDIPAGAAVRLTVKLTKIAFIVQLVKMMNMLRQKVIMAKKM